MFPVAVLALGIAVLVAGNRLSVLGAAVGALLGVVLLRWIPGSSSVWIQLAVPLVLAVIGFFASGFAKGIVDLVILVLGALAGFSITMALLGLFGVNLGLLDWLLGVVGGVIGAVLVRRFEDWSLLILAGLIGGLLVTRGLSAWLPFLQGIAGTLLVLVLAGADVAYHGGLFGGSKKKLK
jgi:hypothetical protein